MNRELMEEQDWAYNESLRIDQEREEQFLREAFAIPKVEAKVEDSKEDPKLTLFQLRNTRIQYFEKKIDLKK